MEDLRIDLIEAWLEDSDKLADEARECMKYWAPTMVEPVDINWFIGPKWFLDY